MNAEEKILGRINIANEDSGMFLHNGGSNNALEKKWSKNFGNISKKDADEALKNTYQKTSPIGKSNDSVALHKATDHFKRMQQETTCRMPRPKVVKVSDIYPNPHRTYYPSCTILHQCSEDGGCCADSTKRCSPFKFSNVTLYFLVMVTKSKDRGLGSVVYEGLSFYNHTECKCKQKLEEVMPRDSPYAEDGNVIADSGYSITESEDNWDIDTNAVKRRNEIRTDKICNCPSEFTVRHMSNGTCICDCFDKQVDCIQYKKGNHRFHHVDKYCINSGQCMTPTCYYGMYSKKFGRCPKRWEELSTEE